MDLKRFAIIAFASGLFFGSVVGLAAASEQSVVLATVHQFIDGLNRSDVKSLVAACASPASIIDDFPPHTWQGPTACGDWAHAFDAANKRYKITDGIVTLATPWHVDVTGDRAYVVAPATYTYKQNGKPVRESGSILTVALKRVGGSWRMTGWAWAQH